MQTMMLNPAAAQFRHDWDGERTAADCLTKNMRSAPRNPILLVANLKVEVGFPI